MGFGKEGVLACEESKIYVIATDGVEVITGSMDKSVTVWDMITGIVGITSVKLTADASGAIRLFTNQDYKEIWKVEAHQTAVISMHCHGSKFDSGEARMVKLEYGI
ncbi:hypothetical protein SS1G_11959 [Sclerotinia sclerotiorum 1980 UF-70]|uniref:Uncharacterized protein n=1 Tax=Sclerotinia sclerotiorum (strain ATCC 18683 / 1980 / Ss-1) TaxID=665079 RepID=A7F3W3_SCLS1|nr:hypothetical protein SS1G_11959 [Sclerotinia sclerotiorum 1980 UF-70]EDN97434.1 hypothetical protein SS1G_11959 [Sclerotinia sclerotiorum 1980 UF-70]